MGLLCMRFLFLKENKNIKGGNITRAMINTDTHHLHLSLPAQRMHLCVVYTQSRCYRGSDRSRKQQNKSRVAVEEINLLLYYVQKNLRAQSTIYSAFKTTGKPPTRQTNDRPTHHIPCVIVWHEKKEPRPSHRYRKIVGFLFHFFKYLIVYREEKGTITQQRNQHVVPSTTLRPPIHRKMKRVRSLSSKFLLHKRVKTHFLYNHFLPINVFCVWLQEQHPSSSSHR